MTALAVLALALAADPTPAATVNLWPGKPPGETAELPPEALVPSKPGQLEIKRLGNVSVPRLDVYLPAKEKATGTLVIVAPGGGYSILAIEHEGTQVAEWLNSIGVAAAVLKYRVPRRPNQSPANLAQLQDAQRAVGLVRSKAAEWGFKPDRVGFLGFSAGGHLAASLCTNFDKRTYDAVDDADKQSCRPDFAVLIYPGGLTERGTETLTPQLKVTKQTPPTFLVHASDDNAEQSAAYYRALKAAGVPAELHFYQSGGHGFGMRTDKGATSAWPQRCAHWLGLRGLLTPPAGG